MGQADERYGKEDNILLAKESVAALVGAPACMYLAWATYERKPQRDVVAIIVCVVELYSISITFGSGLVDSFNKNNTDNSHLILHFWVLFVFVAVLRLLAPLPILYKACNHVLTCVKYHDEHVKKVDDDDMVDLDGLATEEARVIEGLDTEPEPHRGVVVGRAVSLGEPAKPEECTVHVSMR